MPEAAALEVPLVPEMIHRPDAPAHMMRVKPHGRRLTVRLGRRVIAESRDAVTVLEIGRDVADPVHYLPLRDVRAELAESGRSTHCPLKGDTSYFDLVGAGGTGEGGTGEGGAGEGGAGEGGKEIGWSYTRPLPFARVLEGRIAFDAARVVFESAPLSG